MTDKLAILSDIDRRLATIERVDEAKAIRDQAEAIRVYAKSAKKGLSVQNHAAAIKLFAECSAGELLAKVERQQGRTAEARDGKASSLRSTLDQNEISDAASKRWQTLAPLKADIPKLEAECNETGKELTSASLYTSASRRKRESEAKETLRHRVKLECDGLHRGDFRELSPKLIPDESAQLVLTDPPYDGDSIGLFGEAAREAARILRSGGSMLVYSGQKHLFEVGEALSEHLRYWWSFAVVHEGPRQLLQKLGVRCAWKPVIWMVKKTRGDVTAILEDLIAGGGSEKTLHDWQQSESEAARLIELFTVKGEIVVDFFAGSGTVLAAAKKLDRRWIGFELDSGHVERAASRLQ